SLQNDLSNTCLDRGDDGIARGVVGEDTRRYKEMGQAPPDHNKTTRYLDRFDCVPRNAYFIELADTGDAFLLERDLPDYVRLTVFPNLSADERTRNSSSRVLPTRERGRGGGAEFSMIEFCGNAEKARQGLDRTRLVARSNVISRRAKHISRAQNSL